MTLKIDSSLCPLCNASNQCGAALDKRCWCKNEVFDPELLATVPVTHLNKSCICLACLKRYEEMQRKIIDIS